MDLGSRQAVDLVLHRLAKTGTLRRFPLNVDDFSVKRNNNDSA
jgi:hypothetical protein